MEYGSFPKKQKECLAPNTPQPRPAAKNGLIYFSAANKTKEYEFKQNAPGKTRGIE